MTLAEKEQIVDGMKKGDWKVDHLAKKHQKYYKWCPLCMAKQEGEKLKAGFDLSVDVGDGIDTKDGLV